MRYLIDLEQTKAFWDRVAEDWSLQVGTEGDRNRLLNSDPVLWSFAGDVDGLDVLDAGCGTGYLSQKLKTRGARVVGIDFAPEMIRIARNTFPDIDFRVDSCPELKTVASDSIDLVIANYVLMDTPDLEGTIRNFYRVLRHSGATVIVFSHPCFPQGQGTTSTTEKTVSYHWESSYFERWKCIDPPWGRFTDHFIWFHRPLSDYWRAFKEAGFQVEDFDEPHITPERYDQAPNQDFLEKCKTRPYSVAFKLRKPQIR